MKTDFDQMRRCLVAFPLTTEVYETAVAATVANYLGDKLAFKVYSSIFAQVATPIRDQMMLADFEKVARKDKPMKKYQVVEFYKTSRISTVYAESEDAAKWAIMEGRQAEQSDLDEYWIDTDWESFLEIT